MFQTFLADSDVSPSNSKDRQECTSPADTYSKNAIDSFQVLPTPKKTVRAFMFHLEIPFSFLHIWQHFSFTIIYLFFCYFFLSFPASWFFSVHSFPIWGQYFFFLSFLTAVYPSSYLAIVTLPCWFFFFNVATFKIIIILLTFRISVLCISFF